MHDKTGPCSRLAGEAGAWHQERVHDVAHLQLSNEPESWVAVRVKEDHRELIALRRSFAPYGGRWQDGKTMTNISKGLCSSRRYLISTYR